MRSFNFGSFAVDEVNEAAKMVGYSVLVKVTYTSATALILYLAAGASVSGDDHTEIVNEAGTQVTRFTATGSSIQNFQINGLTPGTYLSLKEVSGTGTAVMSFITGSEI